MDEKKKDGEEANVEEPERRVVSCKDELALVELDGLFLEESLELEEELVDVGVVLKAGEGVDGDPPGRDELDEGVGAGGVGLGEGRGVLVDVGEVEGDGEVAAHY